MNRKAIDGMGWVGFGLLALGLGLYSIPAAMVVAGGLLLGLSILAARKYGDGGK